MPSEVAEKLSFRALTHEEVDKHIYDMFIRVIKDMVTKDQFSWKYFECAKDCQKDVWGAFVDDELAGATATLTRPFFRKGERVLLFQLYDSMIEDHHQRKGIYRKMCLHAFEEMKKLDGLFMFGFTNHKSSGALLGLEGAFNSGTSKIMVLPLGADYVSKRVLKRTIPIITPIGSLGVKAFNILRGNYSGTDVEMKPVERFDAYTTELSQRNSLAYDFFPDRSPQFLNWKGIDLPPSFKEYVSSFWFYRGEKRIGYCILCNDFKNNRLKIIDMVCEIDTGVLEDCIKAVRTYARKNKYDVIMMIVAGKPYLDAFKRCGFFAAGSIRTTIVPVIGDLIVGADKNDSAYYQSPIDRDNFTYLEMD